MPSLHAQLPFAFTAMTARNVHTSARVVGTVGTIDGLDVREAMAMVPTHYIVARTAFWRYCIVPSGVI